MHKTNLTRNAPVKNKRRVNKSYTLDSDVVQAITTQASAKKVTTSFLVETILRKYLKKEG